MCEDFRGSYSTKFYWILGWKSASEWLVFSETNGLYVNGYGAIDGQGQAWWDQSCRYHPQLVHLFIFN